VYPPSQSFKPYYDNNSSEDASVRGEEDDGLLEKPETIPKPSGKSHSRLRACFSNAAVISCIISMIIATLTVILLLLLTKGHPITFLKQSTLSSLISKETTQAKVSTVELQHMHCGSTPAEARALGCKFDVMSFAWTPPSCYDHAFSQKFLSEQGPWIFYLDHNATQPLAFDSLSNYDIVWTEHSYHVVHCLYAWERIHQAYLKQDLLLPQEMGSINHTEHCIGLLEDVEGAPAKTVNAIAYLVFDGCVDLN
jgi:hypothetical protein